MEFLSKVKLNTSLILVVAVVIACLALSPRPPCGCPPVMPRRHGWRENESFSSVSPVSSVPSRSPGQEAYCKGPPRSVGHISALPPRRLYPSPVKLCDAV